MLVYIFCAFNLDYSLMQWDDPEDRIAVVGLGLTAVIAFWASLNVIAVSAMEILLCIM